jgi:hypothetical protein
MVTNYQPTWHTITEKPEILHFWLVFRRCPVQVLAKILTTIQTDVLYGTTQFLQVYVKIASWNRHQPLPLNFNKCDNSLKSFDTKHFL